MGGVDKADMLCGLYGVSRKSKKWQHRMSFGLIDRTLIEGPNGKTGRVRFSGFGGVRFKLKRKSDSLG